MIGCTPNPSQLGVIDAPRHADIVVIGGGIVGAASAFFLRQAGLHPVLVERAPALGTATTAASAHSVRAQFTEPENIAMMLESLRVFDRFSEMLGLPAAEADIRFIRQGYLFASTHPDAPATFAARVAAQHALGLEDVVCLDGDEARAQFPWLASKITAATYRAADGWLDGCRATECFARASAASLLLGTEVLTIERDRGRVSGVRTSRGRIATEHVVLATGPFTGTLAGEKLPITLLRRNRLVVAPRPDIPPDAPMTIDADTGAHWRPHQGGALLAWARPEPASPPLHPVPPDPAFPDLILRDPDGVGRLTPFWRDLGSDLKAEDLALTAGQYTITPDHKLLIGPAAETEGLWLHTGYSGHGIMGSPAGARLLADLLAGRVLDEENSFRPGRFAARTPPKTTERAIL